MRLEVGCGWTEDERDPPKGRYPFRPMLKGSDVVYLELKPPEAGASPRLAWVVGDAHRLPFVDRCFEEVASSHVLEHLDDPLLALCEMRRVLKEGRRCHIWVPNWTVDMRYKYPDHKHCFTYKLVRKLLKRAGFRQVAALAPGFSIFPRTLGKMLKFFVLAFEDELRFVATK